jgi:MFS family permease
MEPQELAAGVRRALGVPPAFRYLKYRAYWFGVLASVFGHQVFQFVQFLLVHELTGSLADLGVLGIANAVPAILLGVVVGVFADRWDKRKLIIVTRGVVGLGILLLAVLTVLDRVEVWHVLVIAVLVSGAGAFDGPARSAYYPRLIDGSAMVSAVALNATVWQSTRIVSPAIAGLIVAYLGGTNTQGIAVALFVASGGYVIIVSVMVALRVSGGSGARGNPLRSLVEGLRYIRGNTIVYFLILMAFSFALFGWAFIVLMPVFAKEILEIGPDGAGVAARVGRGWPVVTVGLAVTDPRYVQRRGVLVHRRCDGLRAVDHRVRANRGVRWLVCARVGADVRPRSDADAVYDGDDGFASTLHSRQRARASVGRVRYRLGYPTAVGYAGGVLGAVRRRTGGGSAGWWRDRFIRARPGAPQSQDTEAARAGSGLLLGVW